MNKILDIKDKDKSKDDAQDSTVIFLHIPKCGGTTLVEEILRKNFPPEQMLIHYKGGTEELLSRLQAMNERKKRRIKCVAGHFAFGIHKLLPQSCQYITLLRNPVDRIVSHFKYARQLKNHYLHHLANAEGATLLNYVNSPQNVEVKNGQLRLLAGIGWGYHSGKKDKEVFDRAKENLKKHFVLAGTTEQFDDFIYLLHYFMNWDLCGYEKKNVNNDPTPQINISAETLWVIEGYNRLDQQLYDYVKKSFNKKLDTYSR